MKIVCLLMMVIFSLIKCYGLTNTWLVVVSAKTKNRSAKGAIIEEEILGNASIEGRSVHHRIVPGAEEQKAV